MEILRRGTPPEERKYTIDCPNCRTLFSFLQKEANYQTDPREGSYLTIKCPLCSRAVSTSVDSNYKQAPASYDRW